MKTKFSHWRCEVHNCSSFNMNSLSRHYMPWCDIRKSQRYPSRPKTIGGYNGDVSRKYYLDWIEYCKKRQMDKERELNWHKQYTKLNKSIETYEQTNINKYLEEMI